jgi:hypothetical protein
MITDYFLQATILPGKGLALGWVISKLIDSHTLNARLPRGNLRLLKMVDCHIVYSRGKRNSLARNYPRLDCNKVMQALLHQLQWPQLLQQTARYVEYDVQQ